MTKQRIIAAIVSFWALWSLNFSTTHAQQQTTVYTCRTTPVEAYIMPEMSIWQMWDATSQVQTLFPNAQILDGPSATYNCHAYAYHLTEGNSNRVWINHHDASYIPNSNIQKYWNDCLQVTSNPAAAVKIYYTGDHSAVASGNGLYTSKWGRWPLMRHAPDYVPANYNPNSRVYYERQPPPPPPFSVYISGPDYLYPGQTGYYTAIPSNNNGQINNYTWQIQEHYSNGGISGWLPWNSGGNSPNRSLYMNANLSRVTMMVTVNDNTGSAVGTYTVINPNGGGALRAASFGLTAAPNPASSTALISYTLANEATVVAEIYSADRRQMAVLANGVGRAGAHEHRVDVSRWASGAYTVELTVTEGRNPPRREVLTLNISR